MSMSSSVFERIKTKLDAAGIVYTLEQHEPVITSQDAARVRGVSLHSGAKALVMQGKKSGQHWLFVMPADLRLDKKKAEALVGEPITFAADPVAVTGCVKGSVPPFGSVLELTTYCDKRLSENELINFNAGSLTDSIRMKCIDYLEQEKPHVVDIVEVDS